MNGNANRQKYLESLLSDRSHKMLFILRPDSRVNLEHYPNDNTATFSINDIIAIKYGNKTLYRGSDFSHNPKYTANFMYCHASHRSFLGGFGTEYSNVDPIYRITVTDQRHGRKFVADCYRIIKESMTGKVFNQKRRDLFEREFLKLIDHTDDFNISVLIEKAVEKAHI